MIEIFLSAQHEPRKRNLGIKKNNASFQAATEIWNYNSAMHTISTDFCNMHIMHECHIETFNKLFSK